jgi:hypothetical protein
MAKLRDLRAWHRGHFDNQREICRLPESDWKARTFTNSSRLGINNHFNSGVARQP